MTITNDKDGHVTRKDTDANPVTLSNDALGLKVVGQHDGRLVGTLVAKVDGKWVEVQFAPQDAPAKN